MKLTGGQIVAKALKANGVDYVAGMPGAGSLALLEALRMPGTDIPFIQVIQEHSAVHLADGYYRACGRPMAVVLPVPLGISKALGGIATALADSSAMLVISSSDSERHDSTTTGITKQHVDVSSIEQLPQILRQAFDLMLSGRAGPVSLDIPAVVQNTSIEAILPPATLRANAQLQRTDARMMEPSVSKLCGAALPQVANDRASQWGAALERDAIVVIGEGSIQVLVGDMFPFDQSGSYLCAASAETLGWAVPAAIGAKLAMPARQVVCVVGDGDFLQSLQEMAVCVMHSLPVVFLVFNNSGDATLSDVQSTLVEQHQAGEFNLPDGKPYSPDFAAIARNFGLEAWRVEHASQLNPAFIKALNSKGPSLVEVITARGTRGN
ncbi:thiamine pyrophosphate-binding protein [Pseudomonas sp. WJP1]|uniref:thiamine pyrophosphate-binding protein n=1 Tax=Pseudomonas sp. WJP1 TaxID=2986947 RepID=UPI00234A96DB|nr:thiamine pyrophosphate-dependent enzyme [Pseudomonas sp. WJP1]WCM48565.1 thiamine pyrophosphate-binding protein [Pseudomonas sp. WJP1]